jgi:hypothetical protein
MGLQDASTPVRRGRTKNRDVPTVIDLMMEKDRKKISTTQDVLRTNGHAAIQFGW